MWEGSATGSFRDDFCGIRGVGDPMETPIFDQKYRPILEPPKSRVRDFGVTGMGWAGWLAGWAGWLVSSRLASTTQCPFLLTISKNVKVGD